MTQQHPASQPDPEPGPDAQEGLQPAADAEPTALSLRRAPRYGSFIVTGAVLGALAGFGLSLLGGDGPAISEAVRNGATGYLMVSGTVLGALVGAGLAVMRD